MYNAQEIAQTIKNECQHKNITVKQMLTDCNLKSSTISNMASGSMPRVDTIAKIASYLECPIDYLLGCKDVASSYDNMNNGIFNKFTNTDLYAIGYVDILGCKKIMQSEKCNLELQNLKNLFSTVTSVCKKQNVMFDENIKIKIFSDNIVVAIKTSAEEQNYNALKIVYFLAFFQFLAFLQCGYLIRGGICIGELYIDNNFLYGSGLINAYEIENKLAIYPRIIVENDIAKELLQNVYHKELIQFDKDGVYYINYIPFADTKSILYIDSSIEEFIGIISKKIKDTNKEDDISKNAKILQKLYWTRNYFVEYAKSKNIINSNKFTQENTVNEKNSIADDIIKNIKKVPKITIPTKQK